jgi:hypothetical protein
MKTLTTKQPTNDCAKQKQHRGRVRARSISPLSTGMPLLQRKCACGGGCPRCQDELGIQTKLKIGEPGDKYEQEADRIADEVMRMPEPSVQRQLEPEEEEEEMVQRRAIANSISPISEGSNESEIPSILHEVLRSPGSPLDSQTRLFMESRLGNDFRQVRVHKDSQAIASAQMLNAKAYTLGQNVVFGEGQYTPETLPGKRLLAHELAHTLQQTRRSEPCTLQREENQEAPGKAAQPEQEETNAAKVVQQGVEIVVNNLDDKSPKFKKIKKEVTTQVTKEFKNAWQSFSPTEKGVSIGFGAAFIGTLGAGLAADEEGRKRVVDFLDGKNLIVPPLSLIPYMPISSFKIKRHEAGAKDDKTIDLSTTLTFTPYLELLRKRYPKVPPLDASFDLKFEYDLARNNFQFTGGKFKLKIYQGISISAGTVSTLSPLPEITPTSEGRLAITQASLPETTLPKIPRGFELMINIDFMKLEGFRGKLGKLLKKIFKSRKNSRHLFGKPQG